MLYMARMYAYILLPFMPYHACIINLVKEEVSGVTQQASRAAGATVMHHYQGQYRVTERRQPAGAVSAVAATASNF